MEFNGFIGTWEIIGCVYFNDLGDDSILKGVRFKLEENGDVIWTVSEDLKAVPLFSCETYELYSPSGLRVVIRFGAYAGHVLEFYCHPSEPVEKLNLTCEDWVRLYCKRIYEESNDSGCNLPFTLLPALDEGYFADLIITASNKKEFKVHLCVLQLQGYDIDWQSKPPPFYNLSEEVLATILYYLYAECLPENFDEPTALKIIDSISSYSCLKNLLNKCKLYLRNMVIKQKIIGLVIDMHLSMDQIIEHFNIKTNIVSDPEKLCFVIKQSIRDSAVAGAKLLLLCDLFTKRKNELTRNERHEIIRYTKSRLPIFLMQLQSLLQIFKSTFNSMSAAQRLKIANYLIPEIEGILDTFSNFVDQTERALEQIINALSNDISRNKSGIGDMLSKTLKNVLHIKELTKLKTIHEQIIFIYAFLLQKKESFLCKSSAQKVRSVAKNLEQLSEELPILIMRLEEISSSLDDKLQWREFKFCFKVATSKVSGIVQKLISHREMLQDVISQLCVLVQRDSFTQSLVDLGFLDRDSPLIGNSNENEAHSSYSNTNRHLEHKLKLIESLTVSPPATNSILSKSLLQLLKNPINADMEFEITGNTINNSETNENNQKTASATTAKTIIIKAHRVIIAARCDWFRRALLSGMRESIDKKIIIHDVNPIQFQLFLEYLYCGRLFNQASLTSEQLIELLLLSDRYEVDSLKQTCEYALKSSIDSDSVLYFLSMADQYNAKILKKICLNFICHHQELTETEVFFELPIALQTEIFDRVWTSNPSPRNSIELSSPSVSNYHIRDFSDQSENVDFDEIPSDTTRMQNCLKQLKDIIPDAEQDELIQIVLAADYNLCRAVNYYYSQRNDDNDNARESF